MMTVLMFWFLLHLQLQGLAPDASWRERVTPSPETLSPTENE